MGVYLYGIGPRTENYIAENHGLVIDGILDGYRDKGEFCGIPIVALEDISTENAKIIIVARPASARIIYARIREFCIENKVEICDANGKRMKPEENDWQIEEDKIIIDIEKLYGEIDRHDVVSFDIFDTLLVRKCGGPEKLFAYVAIRNGLPSRFVEERIRAEKELSQSRVPKLDDIYRALADKMPMTQEESRKVLLEEIRAEKKFLTVRKELVAAYYYAVEKRKQVFLVSDMYLSRKVLEDILAAKGIKGYRKLFVSCEHGTDKAGSLFDIMLDEAVGESVLHIGDDEYRDYDCARRHGMDAFLARSLTETVGWDLTNPKTIGYSLLGPALYSFALWLDTRLREDGIKKIYFSARDGYVIKQIFDMVEHETEAQGVNDPIPSEYLLISRSLATVASLSGEDDIRRVMRIPFDGGAEEMLEIRFYLKTEEILPHEDGEEPEEYILRHTEQILKKSKHIRDNYLKYLKGIGMIRPEKAAIFDFVSTGTCQMCLECILDKKLYGYYYETVEDGGPGKSGLYKKGFIQEIGGSDRQYSCDNYFWIETLIKEIVPTLREIDDTGKAVYGKQYMEAFQEEIIRTVQTETIRYAADRQKIMPTGNPAWEETGICTLRMRQIRTKYLAGGRAFRHYDAFANREIKE